MNPKGRIIPAYAGLTQGADILVADEADHPRLRGVNGPLPFRLEFGEGSSPLTRG